MSRFSIGVAALSPFLILGVSARASEPPAADIAAVEACTDLAAQNMQKRPPHALGELDEKTGPEGRLAAAAAAAQRAPASCIGVLAIACIQKEGAPSDSVFRDCYRREAAVWDKRLNAAYQAALSRMEKEAAENLRNAQRAWISWRDVSCRQPWAVYQGTMASPMEAWCELDLTARQAIWMEGWAAEPVP